MVFTKLAMRKLQQNSFSTKLFSRSFLRPCKSIIPTTTMITNTKNKVIIDHSHHILYIILLFGLLLISIFLTSPSNSPSFFPLQLSLFNPSKQINERVYYKDDLERALVGASTENKTVIITIVNKAYVEGDKAMLDLFLDGFWHGEGTRELVNHLLIVAMDQTSYERCKFLHLHCYKLETDGVDFGGEKLFMSQDFIKMMWRRTLFLSDVLKRGYNFIFTDTDVLWLRNPFPNLYSNQTIDLQISIDKFNGSQWSEENPINTGFYMIKSNTKTIALLDAWYAGKDKAIGWKEQDVLIKLMKDGLFKHLNLSVRFLDTLHFSGFCDDSKDVNVVATVHANCCRSISAKLADLILVLHDWRRFKNANKTSTLYGWTQHVNCWDSWKN
ncbi:hypothetical protein EJD97_017681 [Solanum chilense]|uniref:Nucleotide-diphospho-sugar transferase domain-containing protein n=1 Tax=Solanum chilense TaxID=4083 RepID=A0A6N2B2N7_SOLCI|nr:hypothetical protein EJD97_017681 [Solanum chilense]